MVPPGVLRCFGTAGLLAGAGLLFSCGSTVQRIWPSPPDDPIPELITEARHAHEERLLRAEQLRDSQSGWVTPDDCDGFLWTALYAGARGVSEVDLAAAEYPDSPGRLSRRPGQPCWLDNGTKNGSTSSWSRDMGMGLLSYAQAKQDPELLMRHVDYGEHHGWLMGTSDMPKLLSPAYYNPVYVDMVRAVLSSIPRAQLTIQGWPAEWEYFSGLDDYAAHLQMLGINLRANIEGSATGEMLSRIREHSDREPGNPFYWYLRGRFDGDLEPALHACIDGTYGTYVRCGEDLDDELCVLAELIFSCDLVLKALQ